MDDFFSLVNKLNNKLNILKDGVGSSSGAGYANGSGYKNGTNCASEKERSVLHRLNSRTFTFSKSDVYQYRYHLSVKNRKY
jgi:hypothetical protein